jgi:23S rRNA pseudouridine955/2504/2580 synthase
MSISNRSKAQAPTVTYLEISALQAGQRIDNFLQTHLKGVPKSHIYRMLRTGEVRINKGRVKPTYRLQADDILRLPPVRMAPADAPPRLPASLLERLAQSIVYEDKALLILDKPTGIAVHAGSGLAFGVIEGLRALYPRQPYLELAHRLDRETSGCLVLAKTPDMLRRLHDLLRTGGVAKHYLALLKGRWPAQVHTVDAPLRKNLLFSGERLVRVDDTGKPAISHFTVKQNFDQSSLLEVCPLTGRTHQIRVHAAHLGHPLAGDEKYGDRAFNQQMKALGLPRLFLHAARFVVADLGLDVSTPLPEDLQALLDKLET